MSENYTLQLFKKFQLNRTKLLIRLLCIVIKGSGVSKKFNPDNNSDFMFDFEWAKQFINFYLSLDNNEKVCIMEALKIVVEYPRNLYKNILHLDEAKGSSLLSQTLYGLSEIKNILENLECKEKEKEKNHN